MWVIEVFSLNKILPLNLSLFFSGGAYQSTFGVIDLESCTRTSDGAIIFDSCQKTPLLSEVKPSDNYQSVYEPSTYKDDFKESLTYDFLGTPGNAVPEPMAEFTFKAGKNYVFYLFIESFQSAI